MKFDQMCGIILSEAKQKTQKFAKLVVGNSNPVFTKEDILRDVADPTKGSKLYLASKEEKEKGQEAGSEQSTRRQLRRLNWIARTIIKKYANKEAAFSIDDMSRVIGELLERYQTKILGWEAADKANTGYEVRVIGNILLPPTKRNPQGKSVLLAPGMDPAAGVEASTAPVPQKKRDRISGKVIKLPPVTAVDLVARFNEIIDIQDEMFDPDLRDTIKMIVAQGKKKEAVEAPPATETPGAPEIGASSELPTGAPVGEAFEGDKVPVTLRDILKDERIRNVFSDKAVRQMIKGMIGTGELKSEIDGSLTTGSEVGQPSPLAQSIRDSGKKKAEAIEKLKDVDDVVHQAEEEADEGEKINTKEINPDDPEAEMHVAPEDKPKWWVDDNMEEPADIEDEEEEKDKSKTAETEEPKEETEEEAEKRESEEALKRYGFKK